MSCKDSKLRENVHLSIYRLSKAFPCHDVLCPHQGGYFLQPVARTMPSIKGSSGAVQYVPLHMSTHIRAQTTEQNWTPNTHVIILRR